MILESIFCAIFLVVISISAVVDHKKGILPLPLTAIIAVLGVGHWLNAWQPDGVSIFILSFSILAVGHIVWHVLYGFFGKLIFGRGDVKFIAAAALFLGPFGLWIALLFASSFALAIIVFRVFRRHLDHMSYIVRLGPSLALGMFIAVAITRGNLYVDWLNSSGII